MNQMTSEKYLNFFFLLLAFWKFQHFNLVSKISQKLFKPLPCHKINVKKIAFRNKEHTTDKKMGVSVLVRLFISSNEVCNTAYAL